MGIFNFSIPQEEKTLLVAKTHWTSYLSTWAKVLAAVLIPSLLLRFIRPFWWENRWSKIGIVIFVAAAVVYALLDLWKKILTTYIITQCRLIDITQEKIFRRVITEIDADEVEKVIVKQRFWWDKAIGRGNVIVKLKSQKGVLVFYDVKSPETIKTILDGMEKEAAEIIDQKGKECDVVLEDDKVHKIPLSYSYYGNRATDQTQPKKSHGKSKKGKDGLVVVKKGAVK